MATPRLVNLKLTGADGGPLRVDVRSGARPGEKRPAVVTCHGFKGFKDWGFFPRLAERLATAGLAAVSFNFSGSGVAGEGGSDAFDELDRWERQSPSADLADLATVVEWAAEQGAPGIGLVGHSRGGALAILHAAADGRIRSLVTWAAVSTFARWAPEDLARWRRDGRLEVVNARTGQVLPMGTNALNDIEANREGTLDVTAAAGRLRAPWLLVHGTADESVPHQEARLLARASGSPATELLLVEGGQHTFGIRHPWAGSTPAFDEVLERTVAHLSAV